MYCMSCSPCIMSKLYFSLTLLQSCGWYRNILFISIIPFPHLSLLCLPCKNVFTKLPSPSSHHHFPRKFIYKICKYFCIYHISTCILTPTPFQYFQWTNLIIKLSNICTSLRCLKVVILPPLWFFVR